MLQTKYPTLLPVVPLLCAVGFVSIGSELDIIKYYQWLRFFALFLGYLHCQRVLYTEPLYSGIVHSVEDVKNTSVSSFLIQSPVLSKDVPVLQLPKLFKLWFFLRLAPVDFDTNLQPSTKGTSQDQCRTCILNNGV